MGKNSEMGVQIHFYQIGMQLSHTISQVKWLNSERTNISGW